MKLFARSSTTYKQCHLFTPGYGAAAAQPSLLQASKSPDNHLAYKRSSSFDLVTVPGPKHRRFASTADPLKQVGSSMPRPQDIAGTSLIHEISLTPLEHILRRFLLDVVDYIGKGSPPPSSIFQGELRAQPLELRFTGGWVRDKLLGLDSHDIDIGINKMTGHDFGLKMKEYIEIPGVLKKYQLDDAGDATNVASVKRALGGLHKIEANPEKSKHLETVATKLFGLDIDLVNLRKEVYSEDSRTPQMEFGSPQEDALRRDATLNALFYNIHTMCVEDYTGKGLDDLQKGIIRTPLEPYQTFKDDPLRVLRLIRFASRFGYMLDPEAARFMMDQSIQSALRRKISRERVGTEVEKMLRGADPRRALALIDQLELYTTIYTDATRSTEYDPSLEYWKFSYNQCNKLFQEPVDTSEGIIRNILNLDSENAYIYWNLASLVPFADAPSPQQSKVGSKTPLPVAASVAREGIRAPNKLLHIITGAFNNWKDVIRLKNSAVEAKRSYVAIKAQDSSARVTFGMAVRRWDSDWRYFVFLALLIEVSKARGQIEDSRRIVDDYAVFLVHLKELNVLDAWSLKPLLQGKKLSELVDAQTGPWMKEALEILVAWQLQNPGSTDVTAAVDKVKQWKLSQNRE